MTSQSAREKQQTTFEGDTSFGVRTMAWSREHRVRPSRSVYVDTNVVWLRFHDDDVSICARWLGKQKTTFEGDANFYVRTMAWSLEHRVHG